MSDEQKMYVKLIGMFVVFCIFVFISGLQGERRLLDQFYLILLFSDILLYLGSMTYLMDYLRRSHTATWINLGQPRMSANHARENTLQFAHGGFATLSFVLSNRHKKLRDDKLNRLIWLIRVLFTIPILFLPLLIWHSASLSAGRTDLTIN
jgi:hypothetical protein